MTLPAPFAPEVLDLRRATETEYRELYAFAEAIRQERSPDDPPVTFGAFQAQFAAIPDFAEVWAWRVRDREQLVAFATCVVLNLDHNRHVADVSVEVLASYRRRGLGRALFTATVDAVEACGRTLLLLNTNDRIPSGVRALERVGAESGLAQHVNQLVLAELAPDLLDRWLARGAERAGAYGLMVIDGLYPEEHFPALVDLMAENNTIPRGDLQLEDWKTDEEMLRTMNAQHAASGRRRLLVAAQHRDTGRLDGYSELGWHPDRPAIVSQGGTVVRPETRGLGLGRLLKAENLRLLLAENPGARFVRTTNADTNAAMLSINAELGFRPYQATTMWQLPLDRAQTYLRAAVAGV
ncbi:GNAT family N-acetyltransferase [Deinococcus hopiensis]|uniref:Sortase and related acyltransferases n=1 Tax=Deinococcus hopiensis KR-140 TaxID=695939 RepID=A0A1W1VEP6_9DEIO|nr:GNAT family N-acetyltransferase [Deinococcus hopiensis]SMB91424.1 Sortase and related acyltransferases [Deinococcus hopiensis KR-140]